MFLGDDRCFGCFSVLKVFLDVGDILGCWRMFFNVFGSFSMFLDVFQCFWVLIDVLDVFQC